MGSHTVTEIAKKMGLTTRALLMRVHKLGVTADKDTVLSAEVIKRLEQAPVQKKASVRQTPAKTTAKKGTVRAKKTAVKVEQTAAKEPAPSPAKTRKKAEPPVTAAPAPAAPSVAPAPAPAKAALVAQTARVAKKAAPSVNAPAVAVLRQGTVPAKKPPLTSAPAAALAPETPAVQEPVAVEPVVAAPAPSVKRIRVNFPVTVKDLAEKLSVRPSDLIKQLMLKGIFATMNQFVDGKVATEIITLAGYEVELPESLDKQIRGEVDKDDHQDHEAGVCTRAPVVTFMGHVDHGKTSLLDYIKKTKVAEKEHGGITQHVGAYEVVTSRGSVTFLDTPGHQAFTEMRARGAVVTDIVVLVVAGDDGVMPQTEEAIDHARAAGVTIVVAINKCDLPAANVDRVKKELSKHGLLAEDWGGKTIMVPVSAKTGQGIDTLIEMLLLEAEMLQLQANPQVRARGIVLESKLSPGKGPVATVLVKNGTLKVGDIVLCGQFYGKVRAMHDYLGHRVVSAGPAKPVELLGLSGVVEAGDEFFVVKDERKAKTLAELKKDHIQQRKRSAGHVTLETLFKQVKQGAVKDLKLIIKADVDGSLGAIRKSLEDSSTDEIKVSVIHGGIGNINDSDVMLAVVTDAVVIGFNVKIEPKAAQTAEKEEIDIKTYSIIYELIADVHAAMEGLLEPEEREAFQARIVVRKVFSVSKAGTIAGCYVQKGKVTRTSRIRLIRAGEKIHEGGISSLKRFKDDVRDVGENFECGIALTNYSDIKEGDLMEAFTIEKVAKRLR